MYFAANDVAEEKRVAVLLSAIGGKIFSLLEDLLAPQEPGSFMLEVLTDTLRKHFQQKKVVVAERFYFHRRIQVAGESIIDFVQGLRKMLRDCNFRGSLDEVA